MAAEYIEKLDTLPEHMRSGVRLWIEHGHKSYPGAFLTALLSNDFMAVMGTGDDINLHFLRAYAVYFYCYAPSDCYGSLEKFKAWKGLEGSQQ